MVTTVRALKHHADDPDGGLDAVERGSANLERHIGIVKEFGLEPVVAVNRRPEDTDEECDLARRLALDYGAYAAELNEAYEKGGDGATALAEAVVGGLRAAERLRAGLRARRPDRDEDREDRDPRLRRRRRLVPARRAREDRSLHEGRPRHGADLHGEDAPVALARPGSRQRADRLDAPGARPALLHRRRLDRRALRRHADDARPGRHARRSRTSTSTTRGGRSGCSRARQASP